MASGQIDVEHDQCACDASVPRGSRVRPLTPQFGIHRAPGSRMAFDLTLKNSQRIKTHF
jgi:hypothetical protein